MENTSVISFPKDRAATMALLKEYGVPVALGLLALITSLQPLSFVRTDFNFWLGLLAVPFTLRVKRPGDTSYRYALGAGLFLAFFVFTGVRTSFLAAFGCYLFFLIESNRGKLGVLPLFLLAFISPVFKYFSMAWSFPLRLQLSLFSAKILNLAGRHTELQGNVFTTGNFTFSVGEACAGLHMIVTAMIAILIFITFLEQKHKQSLRLPAYLGLFTIGLALVLVSNLFRIIGIVILVALPGSVAHDMIGLFSLVLYVLLPMFLLCNLAVKRLGKTRTSSPSGHKKVRSPLFYFIALPLLILMAFFGLSTPDVSPERTDPAFSSIHPAGFSRSITELGVLKLKSEAALIYVKPAARFFGADHNPAICWRASGYSITGEYISQVAGHEVIMAQLVKGDDKLYTAWWFDNGREQTIGQWEWRIKAARGEPPFRMVNVTALTEAELAEQVEKVFSLSS